MHKQPVFTYKTAPFYPFLPQFASELVGVVAPSSDYSLIFSSALIKIYIKTPASQFLLLWITAKILLPVHRARLEVCVAYQLKRLNLVTSRRTASH